MPEYFRMSKQNVKDRGSHWDAIKRKVYDDRRALTEKILAALAQSDARNQGDPGCLAD